MDEYASICLILVEVNSNEDDAIRLLRTTLDSFKHQVTVGLLRTAWCIAHIIASSALN